MDDWGGGWFWDDEWGYLPDESDYGGGDYGAGDSWFWDDTWGYLPDESGYDPNTTDLGYLGWVGGEPWDWSGTSQTGPGTVDVNPWTDAGGGSWISKGGLVQRQRKVPYSCLTIILLGICQIRMVLAPTIYLGRAQLHALPLRRGRQCASCCASQGQVC
jgi:hypothetical protein